MDDRMTNQVQKATTVSHNHSHPTQGRTRQEKKPTEIEPSHNTLSRNEKEARD